MTQEKYNLNWHTYSGHLRDMLHNMRISNNLTDVTLVCDDQKQFKVHKIVLSACSTVFKNIIDSLPMNNSVIYLRGIQHQEMESLLEFMYLGVATCYQERMNEFLNVAKSLEIKEISKNVEFNNGNEANYDQDVTETTQHQPSEQEEEDNETNVMNDHQNIESKINYTISGSSRRSSSKIVHNTNGNISCGQCDKQFKNRRNLRIHIQRIVLWFIRIVE